MKKFAFSILMVLAMASVASAQKVKGNKNIVTKKIILSSYDGVYLDGSFDVKLVQGKEGEITIKGESNIIPHLEIVVKKNILRISTKKGVRISNHKPVIITVPVEEINSVMLKGAGDIESDMMISTSSFETTLSGSGDIKLNVKADEIRSVVTGSGDIEIHGTTDVLDVKVKGSGDFEGEKLKAYETQAIVQGSGNATVQALKSLSAKVMGSGDIDYIGNPSDTNISVIGSGDVEMLK